MMRTVCFFCIAVAAVAVGAFGALAQSGDVAMVMDLTGPAGYVSGDKANQPVQIADFLYVDDRIRLEKEARIVLIYTAGGGREEIAGPGRIKIGATGSEIENGAVSMKKSAADYLPDGALVKLGDQFAATTLRGSPETQPKPATNHFQILSLCDTRIRTLTPTFRWTSFPEAAAYRLRIFDSEDRLIAKAATEQTAYTFNNDGLVYGAAYRWVVSCMLKDGEGPRDEGWFSILDKTRIQQLKKTETRIGEQLTDHPTERWMALAIIYQTYELFDAAADAINQMRAAHPENKNLNRWHSMVACW